MKATQMAGRVFGRLTVIELREAKPRRKWLCRCACGNAVIADGGHLRSGHTTSCGCALKDWIRENKTEHGAYRGGRPTPERSTWASIIQRCSNPRNRSFPNYGGRGINVSASWRFGEGGRSGFECFLADMGHRPSVNHSIDRIDGSLGYSKENCRWATMKEQNRNRRDNVRVMVNGRQVLLQDAAEAAGLRPSTVYQRIRVLGWHVDDALSRPSRRSAA